MRMARKTCTYWQPRTAFGIAKNHAFVDGNKRTAFVACAVFLRLNGRAIRAPEPAVVDMMNSLAAGKVTESAFADWLTANSHKLSEDA